MGNLSSIIGGAFDLAAQGASAIYNSVQSKKQRKWQEKMYLQQLADTRRMRNEAWARQDALLADERAYNSPENQVALAREAGLNPALINGGQMTSPLTSISGTGASPEAPAPGSYTYTPVQPSSIGARAVGNYFQAESVDVAKNNADTARMNAETQRFAAQARSIRDLAEAGKLDKESAGIYIDNIFKAQTLETRINITNEQLQGLRFDNALKDFDLSFMRPALLDKIKAETDLFQGKLEMIPYQIELYSAQSYETLTSAQKNNEQMRLIRAQTFNEELQSTYIDVMTSIAQEKLSQEQFKTTMQAWDFWIDKGTQSINAVSNLIDSMASVSRARSYGRMAKGAYKGIKKIPEAQEALGKLSDTFNSSISGDFNKQYDAQQRQKNIDWWESHWKTMSKPDKDSCLESPNFREYIYKYFKNK